MKKETMEKRLAYQAQYDKDNTSRLSIKLNHFTDKDILDYLSTLPNKQGYVKALIREDMKKGEQK